MGAALGRAAARAQGTGRGEAGGSGALSQAASLPLRRAGRCDATRHDARSRPDTTRGGAVPEQLRPLRSAGGSGLPGRCVQRPPCPAPPTAASAGVAGPGPLLTLRPTRCQLGLGDTPGPRVRRCVKPPPLAGRSSCIARRQAPRSWTPGFQPQELAAAPLHQRYGAAGCNAPLRGSHVRAHCTLPRTCRGAQASQTGDRFVSVSLARPRFSSTESFRNRHNRQV